MWLMGAQVSPLWWQVCHCELKEDRLRGRLHTEKEVGKNEDGEGAVGKLVSA